MCELNFAPSAILKQITTYFQVLLSLFFIEDHKKIKELFNKNSTSDASELNLNHFLSYEVI